MNDMSDFIMVILFVCVTLLLYSLTMVTQGSSGHADSSSNEGSTQNQSASNSTNQKRKGRRLAKKIPSWGNTQLVIEFDKHGNPCGGE